MRFIGTWTSMATGFLLGLFRHESVAEALPAAAERPVQKHQIGRDGALRQCKLILLRDRGLECGDHAVEVGLALAVLDRRKLYRPARGLGAVLEVLRFLLRIQERDDGIVTLRERSQHRVLVRDEELLEASVFHTDVVLDAAVIEHIP